MTDHCYCLQQDARGTSEGRRGEEEEKGKKTARMQGWGIINPKPRCRDEES